MMRPEWEAGRGAAQRIRAARGAAAAGCMLALASPAAWAGSGAGAAVAQRQGGVTLAAPVHLTASTFSQTCFDSSLTLALNPGCFRLLNPPSGGDCRAHSTHYFVQYFQPSFATPQRIAGFGFISNDGATVFPSAGVTLIPGTDNRFPTPAELANLQVHNVQAAHDTATVVVDLRPFDLRVTSGMDVVICLQFPEGGQLTDVGAGPGILVDETLPDQGCDFFTQNGGTSYNTNDIGNDPLDWGFELIFEPVSALRPLAWSEVKRLYGGHAPALLYRAP